MRQYSFDVTVSTPTVNRMFTIRRQCYGDAFTAVNREYPGLEEVKTDTKSWKNQYGKWRQVTVNLANGDVVVTITFVEERA